MRTAHDLTKNPRFSDLSTINFSPIEVVIGKGKDQSTDSQTGQNLSNFIAAEAIRSREGVPPLQQYRNLTV